MNETPVRFYSALATYLYINLMYFFLFRTGGPEEKEVAILAS